MDNIYYISRKIAKTIPNCKLFCFSKYITMNLSKYVAKMLYLKKAKTMTYNFE